MNVFNAYHNSRIVVPFDIIEIGVSPQVYLGEVIDTAGYEACEFVLGAELVLPNTSDGITIDIFESDDPAMPGGGTLVDDAHLLGSVSGMLGVYPIRRSGYIGKKQYIQLKLSFNPNCVGANVWGICVLMNAWHQPTLKQPN